MKQKVFMPKGYTLSVTSWENDGDYEFTKSVSFESKEVAMAHLEACMLCRDKSNQPSGVFGLGNLNDGEEWSDGQSNMVLEFLLKNANNLGPGCPQLTEEQIRYDLGLIGDFVYDLMGSSEYYQFRVFESAKLYYNEEDVVINQIGVY